MKPDNLFNSENRAVSPVIGVILMVAITVILAAVIGTFVLGLGDSLGDNQPTAQLSVDIDEDAGNITVEHNGGDAIANGTVSVVVTEVENSSNQERVTINSRLSVGSSATGTLNGSNNGEADDVRVRLVHEPSDSILLDRTFETDGVNIGSLADLT